MKTAKDSVVFPSCKSCSVPGNPISTDKLTHRHVCENCGETSNILTPSANLCKDFCSMEAVKLVDFLRAFGIRARVNITFLDQDTKEIISTNASCPR